MPEGNDRGDQSENIEAILDALEQKVERLKVLYEQYFMGIEKIEPLVARKEVSRTILNLAKIQIRNTGLRFRYRTLVQRFNVYVTYWNRILREIELGTYKRDLLRASRAMAEKGAELPQEMAAVLNRRSRRKREDKEHATPDALAPNEEEFLPVAKDIPGVSDAGQAQGAAAVATFPGPESDEAAELDRALSLLDEFSEGPTLPREAPQRPPTPLGTQPPPQTQATTARPPTPLSTQVPPGTTAPQRPPTPPLGTQPPPQTPQRRPPTPAGQAPPSQTESGTGILSRQELETLYRRFVQAKKLCGEPTAGITLDTLAATVQKVGPKIMQEKGCSRVEFTVVIKDDRAILKAIPKK